MYCYVYEMFYSMVIYVMIKAIKPEDKVNVTLVQGYALFSRVCDTMARSVIYSLILSIVWILQETAGEYDGMVTIGAVGDILIHRELQVQASQSPARFRELWKEVSSLMRSVDVAYANMEGPMARNLVKPESLEEECDEIQADEKLYFDGEVWTDFPYFNYHPALAEDLSRDGVDIVSTANNHVMDRCAKGVNKTFDALNKAGIAHTGTRKNENDPWHAVTKWHNMSIAWLSCTQAGNEEQMSAADRSTLVLKCGDTEVISTLVRDLASSHDLVIVTPHWGIEFEQVGVMFRRKALAWLEAGATIILGNHPHITDGVEEYVTNDGRRTMIAYSLGNFVSHMGYGKYYQRKEKFYPRLRTSPFLLIKLARTREGNTVLHSIRYVPLFVKRTRARPCPGCRCPQPFGETINLDLQSCPSFHVGPASNQSSAFKILQSVLPNIIPLDLNQALQWVHD